MRMSWCLLLPALLARASATTSLTAEGSTLKLMGKPYRIFSGSIHYFRLHPTQWQHVLNLAKASGLNTITIYSPWNLHEPSPGVFDFSDGLDLVQFLKMTKATGLNVLFRPGPYICAEWEWGGHPYWLLKDSTMKVRTMHPGYTAAVERYFAKIIPMVVPYLYSNGGPIIAVQVENEYGAYGFDQEYLGFIRNLHIQHGITELLFTSDGPIWLKNGTLPGLYTVVNFQEHPKESLGALKLYQPNRPLMVGEFWSGWFDHWGQLHHVWPAETFKETLETILQWGASFNLYMFFGGTNFSFMNGANKNYTKYDPYPEGPPGYQPTTTSYDYDGPVSEDGRTRVKFFIVQDLLRKYNPDFSLTPELAAIAEEAREEQRPVSEGRVSQPYSQMKLTDALTAITPVPISNLINMEMFDQAVGYAVYRYSLGCRRTSIPTVQSDEAD